MTEKDDFLDQEDMTGLEAQNDPEFAKEAMVESDLEATGEDIEDLEAALDAVDDFDNEDYSGLSGYEKFIVLPKRELNAFIRAVEPLTKNVVDQYGKSVQVKCLDNETVELSYSNRPYRVAMKVANKSQKTVDTFYLEVSLLKRIVAEQYASLVIVQTGETYNLAIFDSILFLETKKLAESEYNFNRHEFTGTIDKEVGLYNFRKLGSVLNTSERASEKIIVVKGDECFYNTGVFSARVKSAFSGSQNLLLYKPVVDLLGVLMELAKVDVKYVLFEEAGTELMALEADGIIYCEVPATADIEQHYSPAVTNSLNFNATVQIVNDSMIRLFSLVKSLDYLSDIVTVKFENDTMALVLHDQKMTKSSVYEFKVVDGKVATPGEMRVSASVMKPYMEVTGSDVRYDFNEQGLCMKNENGSFLIRRTN